MTSAYTWDILRVGAFLLLLAIPLCLAYARASLSKLGSDMEAPYLIFASAGFATAVIAFSLAMNIVGRIPTNSVCYFDLLLAALVGFGSPLLYRKSKKFWLRYFLTNYSTNERGGHEDTDKI